MNNKNVNKDLNDVRDVDFTSLFSLSFSPPPPPPFPFPSIALEKLFIIQ